jgi:hypothetical protein
MAESTAQSTLQPAGSDLADGLVVPEGTRLAGAVFARPSEVQSGDDWTAHLVIDGDPFAAWDDVAGELRDGDQAAPMSGSADACTWTIADDAVLEPDAGNDGAGGGATPGEPVDGGAVAPRSTSSATGDAPTTTQPTVDPYVEATAIIADAPIDEVDGLECSASASSTKGMPRTYTVQLRSGGHWPATLTIESRAEAPGSPAAEPSAWRLSLERQAGPGGSPTPAPGPEPVPAGAADHVPDPPAQDDPGAGDPFGTEVNCFVGKGYEQLVLPPGASYVAGGFLSGQDSVLAVDDAEAAIADIQRQTAGDGTSEDGPGTIEQLDLSDGRAVTEFRFGVSAGGGACGARSSPDGRFLVVSVHGD